MSDEGGGIRMRVHDGDSLRVDGILRLIEIATRAEPLPVLLREMVEQVRLIAHADVVSVYVRERTGEGDRLVMRANVGFPASAIGHVRLAPGEGIVGTAAEILRPISCSVAQEDSHYKHFPELGEERYPSLVAIPLSAGGACAGVLVLQRAERGGFTDAEIALATVLASTFSYAFERASTGEAAPSRSARLLGEGLAPGGALGRAVMLGSLEALREPPGGRQGGPTAATAFDEVATLLRRGLASVRGAVGDEARRALDSLVLTLDDRRLYGTLVETTERLGTVRGLRQLARQYAGTLTQTVEIDPFLEERAIEVESLCLLVATRASGYPLPASGALLVVAERLGTFATLALVGAGAGGAVCAAPLDAGALGVRVLAAAGLPVVAGVPGLFAWVRPGDTLRVDGASGVVRVNPPATAIRRHRREAKSGAPTAPPPEARAADDPAADR